MNNYFSIGELSKLQNISRQTLIFYDKIGLFTPAYINPENGYRYYNANQLDYLDTICIMKKIGFSLEEIKEHMKNYTLDSSVIALRKQLTIIQNQIHELELIKTRVEHRCQQLEQSANILDNYCDVFIENVNHQYILLQEVDKPYTMKNISIAVMVCNVYRICGLFFIYSCVYFCYLNRSLLLRSWLISSSDSESMLASKSVLLASKSVPLAVMSAGCSIMFCGLTSFSLLILASISLHGMVIQKVVPLFSMLSNSICPPIREASCWQMMSCITTP